MDNPVDRFWHIKLEKVLKKLASNNFEVHMAKDRNAAKKIAIESIIPEIKPKTISWGGSMTFVQTGLYDALKTDSRFSVLDTYDKNLSADESLERRRRSLLSDLYVTGVNAVTEAGRLVNLDMIGNRVAALTFGPKHVLVFAGRNKISPDLESAMHRVKHYAAPVNVMRLEKKNPCLKTAVCKDCNGPERICNTWTITEKSFPVNRVKIILINEDLGF